MQEGILFSSFYLLTLDCRVRTNTMCKRNLSQPIYIAYKLSAMLLVSVELHWHETGRGQKSYLQGEILIRSHTRLSFSCLKMLDH